MNLLELFEKLIAFNTESKLSNREMTDFICSLLYSIGFEKDKVLVTSLQSGENVEKCNIVAIKGDGPDGLMLAGHMDTVSPEPYNQWKTDPFVLTRKKDRLYGLGATDMKLFLAAAIKVAEEFPVGSLKHPLVLVFTHDEETSMIGAKHLKKEGLLRARYGIVGEPTQLVPVRLHKGWLGAEVIIHGRAGHGSDPKEGHNAIELAQEFLSRLFSFRDDLRDFNNPILKPSYPTLNVGIIQGGGESNKIPGECRVEFEVRPIPGQDLTDITNDLKQIAKEMGEIDGQKIATIKLTSAPINPMETLAGSLVVRVAEKITAKEAIGVSYNTEATLFNSAGVETIVLGPGNIAQAHQPNEFVTARYLDTTVETLRNIIAEICTERR